MTVIRSANKANRLLAVVSAFGLVSGLSLVTGGSALAASGGSAGGGHQQAVVALAGGSAVTVPGVRVQALLPAVHSEIVTGDAASLAALAQAPGVLGVSPNAAAHLEGYGYGPAQRDNRWDHSDNGKHGNPHDAPSPADGGVLAASTLGGSAGQPGAGDGVTVALIDTGVTDTDALNRASGRLVDAVDTSGLNNDDGVIEEHGTFTDGYGHGTFMASLIAGGVVDGTGDLALGVAPGATVDVVKVADDEGNTSLAAVLAGLNWVATHSDSVDVANLSLAVDRPSGQYGIDPLNFAVTLTRAAGVTVVVAAGNTPGVVGDPGFDPAALTVGAADTTGDQAAVASFSGYANVDGVAKPDVVAAGVNILGEMPDGALISQQHPTARQPSGLFRGSGTSQSTALVSGLAALYLQAHEGASPYEVKAAIRGAATKVGNGKTDGQGLVAVPTGTAYDPSNTGEQGLNLAKWYSTANIWGPFWLGADPDTDAWNVRNWTVRNWTVRNWTARHWLARNWTARNWTARNWTARNWTVRNWTARNWTVRNWAAASWDGGVS
ncbi:MAG TPA: S8 family serine peptidase [Acidothermaceae bacterium]